MSTSAALIIKNHKGSKAVEINSSGDEHSAINILGMATNKFGDDWNGASLLEIAMENAIKIGGSFTEIGVSNFWNTEDPNEAPKISIFGKVNTEKEHLNWATLTDDLEYLQNAFDYVYEFDKTENYPFGVLNIYKDGNLFSYNLGEGSHEFLINRGFNEIFDLDKESVELLRNIYKKNLQRYESFAKEGYYEILKAVREMEYRPNRHKNPTIEQSLNEYNQPLYEEGRVFTINGVDETLSKLINKKIFVEKSITNMIERSLGSDEKYIYIDENSEISASLKVLTKKEREGRHLICSINNQEILNDTISNRYEDLIRLNFVKNINFGNHKEFVAGDFYTLKNGKTAIVQNYDAETNDIVVKLNGENINTNVNEDLKILDVDFNGGGTAHPKGELGNRIIQDLFKVENINRRIDNADISNEKIAFAVDKLTEKRDELKNKIKVDFKDFEGESTADLYSYDEIMDRVKSIFSRTSSSRSLYVATTWGDFKVNITTPPNSREGITHESFVSDIESRQGTNNTKRLEILGNNIIKNLEFENLDNRNWIEESKIAANIFEKKIVNERISYSELDEIMPDGIKFDYENAGGGAYIDYKDQKNVEHYTYPYEQFLGLERLAAEQDKVAKMGYTGAFFNLPDNVTGNETYKEILNVAGNFRENLSKDQLLFETKNKIHVFNNDGTNTTYSTDDLDENEIPYHTIKAAGFIFDKKYDANELEPLLSKYNVDAEYLSNISPDNISSINDFIAQNKLPEKEKAYSEFLHGIVTGAISEKGFISSIEDKRLERTSEDIVSREAASLNEDGSEIVKQSAGMKIN